jgi:WS/DGAT/MGAT family acyltransferase
MSPADVAFLHRESRTAPQHVAGLAVFDPPAGGFAYDRLVRLLEERIAVAPRYRQKVRSVPGHLAHPVWVDDPEFDITYHVRRSGLPRPGTEGQLLEFCARIVSRLLDRSRPLWEMYLVEGLADNRVAILTKTHEAMVSEQDGIDLAGVLLDAAPEPRRTVGAIWLPEAEPSSLALLRGALGQLARQPLGLTDTVRGGVRSALSTATRASSFAGETAAALTARVRQNATSPLRARLSEQRRLAVARTRLADYRRVRDATGGTVNQVALAVTAGALRGWLLSRAEPLRPAASLRALLPVSVQDLDEARRNHPARQLRVRPLLVDLPVGEPDPKLRLTQLGYAMAAHHASGRAVSADRLAALSGFAPPTLHALGARAASGLASRLFDLVLTNVPGPQLPLFAAGARMTEMFPILPLASGQPLSIALTSYDGGVYYGVTGDRDALHDVALVAELIEESLAELVAATAPRRSRRAGAPADHSTAPPSDRRPPRPRSER